MEKSISILSLVPTISKAMSEASKGGVYDPMLVVLPRQVELELLMDKLCDELEHQQLVRFTGEKRWLNIRLGSPSENGFESFERMFVTMRRSAGYSNRFRGVVRIDATEWLGSEQDERLQAVFAYIHDHADEIFFVISVTADEPECAVEFELAIERWLYVNAVAVKPYETAELAAFVQDRLLGRGQKLSEGAGSMLYNTIDKLSKQEGFAGLREIEGLANAVSRSAGQDEIITIEHIAAFAPDGVWMTRRTGTTRSAIGFGGGEINGECI